MLPAQDALREKAVEAARMQASLEVAQVDKAQAEKDLQEERRCRRDAEHAVRPDLVPLLGFVGCPNAPPLGSGRRALNTVVYARRPFLTPMPYKMRFVFAVISINDYLVR